MLHHTMEEDWSGIDSTTLKKPSKTLGWQLSLMDKMLSTGTIEHAASEIWDSKNVLEHF